MDPQDDPKDHHGDIAKLRAVLAASGVVRFGVLFGSTVEGASGPDSDYDVAVEFDEDVALGTELDLQAALTLAVGRAADLLRLDGVSTGLRFQVASQGHLLWGDRAAFVRFQVEAAAEHIDFAPARAMARERCRLMPRPGQGP